MLNRKLVQFLRRPRVARLATIGPDGYPHIVPIYFMLEGEDIIFGSDNGERKVRNALANHRGAVVIGGEPGVDEEGYMLQGDLSIEVNPDRKLVRRLVRRYEQEAEGAAHEAEWAGGDMVLIRLKPKRIIQVW